MDINIPLGLAPIHSKKLFGFNEGSQWRSYWPCLTLTTTHFYLAVWIAGRYRRICLMWRPARMPYHIQRILALPHPIFPCSFEVEVEDRK